MYLVDANVFITAKNGYYAFDIVPGFWSWLERQHVDGRLFTVEKVKREILAGDDELATWMQSQPADFAVAANASTQPSLRRLSEWVVSGNFTAGALSAFLSSADYYLVAQAHELQFTVVTNETPDPNSRKRVKIPDACNALGVRWISPFTMLRREGAQFDL